MIDKYLAELRVQVKTLKDDICIPTVTNRDQMNKIRFEMIELQIDLVENAIKRIKVEPPKIEGEWGPKTIPNGWGAKRTKSTGIRIGPFKPKNSQKDRSPPPPLKVEEEPKKS